METPFKFFLRFEFLEWMFYIQIVISGVLNKGNVWSAGNPKGIYPLCRLTYTLGSKQERYLQLQ
jgi:hypothetical protein